MMNLNEMTSKQLKELGKQHHIKDWWNLSKAALISALSELEKQEAEQANVKAEIESEPTIERKKELKKPNLKMHELTFNGKTQSIREWAIELEMPWPTLYDRVNRNGWTVEEALTVPLGGRRKNKREA